MTPVRLDETLYSAAARLGRYVGAKGRTALQMAFFGEDAAVFDEMPTGIARIVASRTFPPIEPTDAVREWTLFPYYSHFAEPRLARRTEAAMLGDGTWPHHALESWTGSALPPERLRFCHDCHREMIASHGEPWWRRTHQLPSTLVCPAHGGVLAVSTVDRAKRRRAYLPPSPETCPADAEPAVIEEEPRVLHDLLSLARQGDLVLNDRSDLHPDERRESYLQALNALGMLNRLGEANVPAVAEAMKRYWGTTLRHWPTLWRDERCEQGWLYRLLTGGHGSPPLHHLLLEGLLSALVRAR